jgi:hypothetical protein
MLAYQRLDGWLAAVEIEAAGTAVLCPYGLGREWSVPMGEGERVALGI